MILQQIDHRGKDNRIIYMNGNVTLGHNRLSINDVSELGNQNHLFGMIIHL